MWPFKKQNQEQENKRAVGAGIIAGLGQLVYIILVVLFFQVSEKLFPPLIDQRIIIPLFMLTLFVFSAGISGLIVFGYPAQLAFQKKFKLAIIAAVSALVTLIAVGILILFISFLI